MGRKYTKRGENFFTSTDGIWQRARFQDLKEPCERAPERNLIKMKDLEGLTPEVEDQLLETLLTKKRNEILREREAKRKKGLEPKTESRKHTLSDAIKKCFDVPHKYFQLLEPGTITLYKGHLENWEELIGNLKLSQLNPSVIEHNRDMLRTPNRGNSTLNRHMQTLSALFGHCMRFKDDIGNAKPWVESNPCLGIEKLPEPPIGEKMRAYSVREQQRLLSFCNPELKFTITLSILTGARQKEVWNLPWEEVNFDSQWITFRKTKNKDLRTVPIFDQQIWDAFRVMFEDKQDGISYVFPSSQGNKRRGNFRYIDRPKSFRSAFETARKKAGLENFRWHDFRHTAITEMMHAGMIDEYIMQFSGHKSKATLQRYKTLFPVHLIEQAKMHEEYKGRKLAELEVSNAHGMLPN